MQTGRCYFQVQIVAQPFLELFDKEYTSLSIQFADAFHMVDVAAFALKIFARVFTFVQHLQLLLQFDHSAAPQDASKIDTRINHAIAADH